MPRLARMVVTDVPYHVTQTGNRQQDIFFKVKDYQRYLDWLSIYSSRYQFEIHAYCLMPNHIHLVGTSLTPDSMPRTIQVAHVRHTQAINREHGWRGHLWHSKYFATALDDCHLWMAIRYVEQNPLRAGMVTSAEKYSWSSAAFHCGIRKSDPLLTANDKFQSMFENWMETLQESPDDETLELLRRRTQTGVPCGNEKFVNRISKITGHDYVDRMWGRPRKADK